MRGFTAIDLTPQCEQRGIAHYKYELLERIECAPELIGQLSGQLWQNIETFQVPIATAQDLHLSWLASAPSSGIAVIRDSNQTLSISLLLSGLNESADRITLEAFQRHIVRLLKNTPFEPAFDLLGRGERPLLATLGLFLPDSNVDRRIFAIADRCFAAAYFRRLGLI